MEQRPAIIGPDGAPFGTPGDVSSRQRPAIVLPPGPAAAAPAGPTTPPASPPAPAQGSRLDTWLGGLPGKIEDAAISGLQATAAPQLPEYVPPSTRPQDPAPGMLQPIEEGAYNLLRSGSSVQNELLMGGGVAAGAGKAALSFGTKLALTGLGVGFGAQQVKSVTEAQPVHEQLMNEAKLANAAGNFTEAQAKQRKAAQVLSQQVSGVIGAGLAAGGLVTEASGAINAHGIPEEPGPYGYQLPPHETAQLPVGSTSASEPGEMVTVPRQTDAAPRPEPGGTPLVEVPGEEVTRTGPNAATRPQLPAYTQPQIPEHGQAIVYPAQAAPTQLAEPPIQPQRGGTVNAEFVDENGQKPPIVLPAPEQKALPAPQASPDQRALPPGPPEPKALNAPEQAVGVVPSQANVELPGGGVMRPGPEAPTGEQTVTPTAQKPEEPPVEVPHLVQAFNDYNKKRGAPPLTKPSTPVDEAKSQAISDFYTAAQSQPHNPAVRAAYDALNGEVDQQYSALVKKGYKFEPTTNQTPYPDARAMAEDLADNKHLWVFTGSPPQHGLMTAEQNTRFRAVRDATHAAAGATFGHYGEEQAYRAHQQTFSPLAQKAMATETRGQNAAAHFQPGLNPPETRYDTAAGAVNNFPEQKALILPEKLRQRQGQPSGAWWPGAEPKFTYVNSPTGPQIHTNNAGMEVVHGLDPKLTKTKPSDVTINNLEAVHLRGLRALGHPELADAARQAITQHGEGVSVPVINHNVSRNPKEIEAATIHETLHAKANKALDDAGFEWPDLQNHPDMQPVVDSLAKLKYNITDPREVFHETLAYAGSDDLHGMGVTPEQTLAALGVLRDHITAQLGPETTAHLADYLHENVKGAFDDPNRERTELRSEPSSVGGGPEGGGGSHEESVLPSSSKPGPGGTAAPSEAQLKPTINERRPGRAESLLGDEVAGKSEKTIATINSIFQRLPDTADVVAMAKRGEIGRYWYENSAKALKNYFGDDAPRFTALLAAQSPRQLVRQNLKMALDTWKAWEEAGRPEDPAQVEAIVKEHSDLPARVPNSVNALLGRPEELSGQKVASFYKNLSGDVNSVTNDVWMARMAGVAHAVLGKETGYLALRAKILDAAKDLGWAPQQVQASVWSFIKPFHDLVAKGLSAKDALRYVNPAAALDTGDFAQLFKGDPDVRAKLQEILAASGGNLDALESTFTPADAPKYGTEEGTPAAVSDQFADRFKKQIKAEKVASKEAKLESAAKKGQPALNFAERRSVEKEQFHDEGYMSLKDARKLRDYWEPRGRSVSFEETKKPGVYSVRSSPKLLGEGLPSISERRPTNPLPNSPEYTKIFNDQQGLQPNKPGSSLSRFLDKASAALLEATRKLTDKWVDVRNIMDAAEKQGIKVPPSANPYLGLQVGYGGGNGGFAATMMDTMDVLKDAKKSGVQDELTARLNLAANQRSLDVVREKEARARAAGDTRLADEYQNKLANRKVAAGGFDDGTIARDLAELKKNTPPAQWAQVEALANREFKLNADGLDFWHALPFHPMEDGVYQNLKARGPEYVTMSRIMEPVTEQVYPGGRGMSVKQSQAITPLEGSELTNQNPWVADPIRRGMMYREAARQLPVWQLHELAKAHPGFFGQIVREMKGGQQPTTDEGEINYLQDGKAVRLAVPKPLAEAIKLSNLNDTKVLGQVLLEKAANLFRPAMTGMNLAYAATSPIREGIDTATFLSQFAKSPLDLAKFLKENYTALGHIIAKDDTYRDALRAGVGYTSLQSRMDPLVVLRNQDLRQLLSPNTPIRNALMSVPDTISGANEALQLMSKIGARQFMINQGMDPAEATAKARFYAGRPDVANAGTMTSQLNPLLMFFVDKIKGSERSWRFMKTAGKVALGVAAAHLAGELALNRYNANFTNPDEGDAEWNHISDRDKEDNYLFITHHVITNDDGSHRLLTLKIPRGRVFVGGLARDLSQAIFKQVGGMQSALNGIADVLPGNYQLKQGHVGGGLFRGTVGSVNPLLQEPMEQAANTDTYTGQPIETEGMQNVEPWARYRESTSPSAVAAGKVTGLSPVRIEHALRNFGGLGESVMGVFDAALRGQDKRAPAGDTEAFTRLPVLGPVVRRFVSSAVDQERASKEEAFYGDLATASQALSTFDEAYKDSGKWQTAVKEFGNEPYKLVLAREHPGLDAYSKWFHSARMTMTAIAGAKTQGDLNKLAEDSKDVDNKTPVSEFAKKAAIRNIHEQYMEKLKTVTEMLTSLKNEASHMTDEAINKTASGIINRNASLKGVEPPTNADEEK